ncbi:MAG: 50S ribosomal protein L14 [Parachlamydiaceae bacterium]
MIQQETELEVADNSGAKRVKCIKVLGGTRRRYAAAGDIIICSVREALPGSNVSKGDIVRAVIVRTAAPIGRSDGTKTIFGENACVLLDDKNNPKGTRIFGPIAREVRNRDFLKIASMAIEVV